MTRQEGMDTDGGAEGDAPCEATFMLIGECLQGTLLFQ